MDRQDKIDISPQYGRDITKRSFPTYILLTRVISLDAAAALMCKLGCLTVLVQSNALANVPTDLKNIGLHINLFYKKNI